MVRSSHADSPEKGKCFLKNSIEERVGPKPEPEAVSTIIRIPETKDFVGHEEFGKSNRYFPLESKKEYSKFRMNDIVKNHENLKFSLLLEAS